MSVRRSLAMISARSRKMRGNASSRAGEKWSRSHTRNDIRAHRAGLRNPQAGRPRRKRQGILRRRPRPGEGRNPRAHQDLRVPGHRSGQGARKRGHGGVRGSGVNRLRSFRSSGFGTNARCTVISAFPASLWPFPDCYESPHLIRLQPASSMRECLPSIRSARQKHWMPIDESPHPSLPAP
jgi:hypothetical protein